MEEGEKLFRASAALAYSKLGDVSGPPLIPGASCLVMLGPISEGVSMLLTADQHRRLAEVYEEAAADQSHSAEDRAFLAEKAARFWMLARSAGEMAKAEMRPQRELGSISI